MDESEETGRPRICRRRRGIRTLVVLENALRLNRNRNNETGTPCQRDAESAIHGALRL